MARGDQIDQQYQDRLTPEALQNSEREAGENSSAYASAGIDQAEAYMNDPANASQEELERRENEFGYTPNESIKRSRALTVAGFLKKRGASIGIVGLILTGGLGLMGLFGPATMIVNLMENFSLSNDSSSTAMERRFMKVFGFATGGDQKVLCKNSKIKCKMGRISNSALRKLENKGLKACFDGVCGGNTKRTGYPENNPTHYEIDVGDGSEPKRVAAKDLAGFLAQKENRKIAGKVLGTGGAFNLRYRAWIGKHIANKFYKKFNLKRDGGLARGDDDKTSSLAERLAAARNSLTQVSTPDASMVDSAADGIEKKVQGKLSHAKKGGPVYLSLYAGCTVPKIPKYVAAAAAAIQLAQILPIVTDTVLSPGGKNKATGIENSFGPEDAETIGTLLTEETTRESDGKKTSALDSPYLLAAMGTNKNKPPVSKDFTPGYSVLKNQAVQSSGSAEDLTESKECDAITSPQAMYGAMALDAAATAAASATIIGGLIKFGVSWAISEAVMRVVTNVAGGVAKTALKSMLENDKIPTAKGEALGDILGIGAMAFFSGGGMARHLPTLKKSQLTAYNQVKEENEAFRREVEIASLSPFDTSSRYTFLGSIIHNTQMAMIAGGSINSFGSIASRALQLPAYALSPTVSAATNFTDDYCGYAEDFGLEGDAAVNAAGMPCTGLLPEQTSMSVEEAIDLMLNEGWLDESKGIEDDDSIQDLVDKGYIKKDTPLYDFIEQCSDPSTGDYMFNGPGCQIGEPGDGADSENERGQLGQYQQAPEGEESDTGGEREVPTVKNPRSIIAMSVFLVDYQVLQTMNGEDEEEGEGSQQKSNIGTVMSWNVRGADKDGLAWSARKGPIVKTITERTPDIIGLQEMNEDVQHDDLKAALPDYGWVGGEGEANKRPILWNNSVYEKLENGIFKHQRYSDNEKQPEPWVKLKNKTSGSELFVFNYHGIAHDRNAEKKIQGAKDLVKAVDEIAGSTPAIVLGDFNSDYGMFAHPIILAAGFVDTFQVAQTKINADYTTHHDDPGTPRERGTKHIDHIFIRPNTPVSVWENIITYDTTIASDHTPIIATIGGGDDSESGDSGSGGSWNGDASAQGFQWPAKSGTLSSCFRKPGHTGIDIVIPTGSSVYAAKAGEVVQAQNGGDAGNYVMIKHENGLWTNYQHNSRLLVKAGDLVTKGQEIAKSGSTGFSTGPHIHFSVTDAQTLSSRKTGTNTLNPMEFLPTKPSGISGSCS